MLQLYRCCEDLKADSPTLAHSKADSPAYPHTDKSEGTLSSNRPPLVPHQYSLSIIHVLLQANLLGNDGVSFLHASRMRPRKRGRGQEEVCGTAFLLGFLPLPAVDAKSEKGRTKEAMSGSPAVSELETGGGGFAWGGDFYLPCLLSAGGQQPTLQRGRGSGSCKDWGR